MRYLGLHKLLWFLIVVTFTLFEGMFILVFWVLYVVWNFKIPKNVWRLFHNAEDPFDNHWGGYAYEDNNIWETIIRRYKYTFDTER